MVPHLDRPKKIGIATLLVRPHHNADGHVLAGKLAVALNDRPVLGTIEVELEDDPVRLVELAVSSRCCLLSSGAPESFG